MQQSKKAGNKVTTYGAFGVIRDSAGKVLLVRRRDYPLWDLPGGTQEAGELPELGVRREIREETGLNGTIDHLVGTYFRLLHDDVQSIFVINVSSDQQPVAAGPETKELAYFAPDNLPQNLVALRAEQIQDAVAGKKALHVIVQENRWVYRGERILRWFKRR